MLTALLIKYWRQAAIAAGFLFLLLVILLQWQCGTSKQEQKLEDLNNQGVEQQAVEQGAERRAKESERRAADKETEARELDKVAKDKVKEAREIQNADKRGTTFEEANRNRCLAYPDDPGCK